MERDDFLIVVGLAALTKRNNKYYDDGLRISKKLYGELGREAFVTSVNILTKKEFDKVIPPLHPSTVRRINVRK